MHALDLISVYCWQMACVRLAVKDLHVVLHAIAAMHAYVHPVQGVLCLLFLRYSIWNNIAISCIFV